ncbi:MAG: pseudouridine-5'-phosphate glycosidase, partial [Marinovum sp.]|nr:pseudouridine-5'-phosphate glycosidase [Marinovum sp.]
MIEIDVGTEVQDALNNSKPVVALESTIITHGMPWPENKQVALRVEKSV